MNQPTKKTMPDHTNRLQPTPTLQEHFSWLYGWLCVLEDKLTPEDFRILYHFCARIHHLTYSTHGLPAPPPPKLLELN